MAVPVPESRGLLSERNVLQPNSVAGFKSKNDVVGLRDREVSRVWISMADNK